jgi:PAS domain S-box-containing protein
MTAILGRQATGMKVIVLDPLEGRQQLAQDVLAGRGHRVTVVRSVAELIAARRSESHHLVLVSADIIRQEGLPLSQQLRLPGQKGSCAILALDGDLAVDPRALLAAGVDDVLAGPLDPDKLILRTSIAEYRLRRSLRRDRWFEDLIALGTTVYTVTDDRATVLYTSPSLTNVSGLRPGEMIGRSVFDLVIPEDVPLARRLFAEIASKPGETTRAQLRCWNEGRTHNVVEVSIRNCLDDPLIGGMIVTLTDVTKQREIEERYRLIAENVSDVIWTQHLPEPVAVGGHSDLATAEVFAEQLLAKLEATYVSPSVTRMLGYSVSEALAASIRDVLTPRSYADLRRFIAATLLHRADMQSEPVTLDLEYLTKDGGTRWGEFYGNFLWDEQCRIVGTLVVTRDITERKQVEEALLDSEQRLRRLIENMPDFVILVDEDAEIHYVNRGVGALEAEQLVGRRGFSFLVEEHHPACRAAFAAALRTGKVQYVEAQDVFGLWWSCRLVPLKEKAVAANVMVICTDVTEERRANEAVCKEQDLLRHLIDLHERDRKVLAFELHDGFAQQLTGAIMSLEVASRLTDTSPEKARAPLEEAMRLLRDSIEESRRLVSGLCPPVLDQFGIVAAVEHLVSLNHCDEQLAIEFVSRGHARRLAAPLENAVFRIVQETLANIRRHSKSRKAAVELCLDNQFVSVEVRDWGTGFDPDAVNESCFGLRGIRERARLLGGQAEILSHPGRGTTVRVSLPMIEPCPDDGSRKDRDSELL